MFFTVEKLERRIDQLFEYRYRDPITIRKFECQIDEEGVNGAVPPDLRDADTIQLGEIWSGRDHYLWLQTDVEIPREWNNRRIVGVFDFGKTGGGNNSGFESLIYIDGLPYQGVDSNHKEVFLPTTYEGIVRLQFRLWSGLEGGGVPQVQEHKVVQAEVAWLDESTDDLYFTARAILETINYLDENSSERVRLLHILNRSFLKIDWSYPGTKGFYESVSLAQASINEEMSTWTKSSDITIHAVGHTHIDVAWLWQLKHTREKAARSWSTVLRLMEQYPEFRFTQTQPQLYEYVKSDYPELYKEIKERVVEQRWEAGGGMWLEADCNIPSGESLVRQLLTGIRFFESEFGVKSTYLWLPDVFGYSWALPQILKKADIDKFVTTKISWNEFNRMPHDTFMWKGIDGTEILTHFITTPCPEGVYTYNGLVNTETVKGTWDEYRDKLINQDLLLAYGYGDGGGGVNREMLEMRRRFDSLPGLPNVKTSTVDNYLSCLADNVKDTDEYVHTWDGELYLEYHRGTYTSQAFVKKENRQLELLLREAEWLSVYNCLLNEDWGLYPFDKLNRSWKILLRNQFHDIIPGSSIHEVYEDARNEYNEATSLAQSVHERIKQRHSSADYRPYSVLNSSPWNRSSVISVPIEEGMEYGRWLDDAGAPLTVQRNEDTWLVQLENLSPMSVSPLYFLQEDEYIGGQNEVFQCKDSGVSTPFYEISWNTSGQLLNIFDKGSKREILAEGSRGNVLQVFEDKPIEFNAWNIDIFYQEKMREIDNCRDIQVIENGPLRVRIKFEWIYANSRITQHLTLYSNRRRIDFQTEVDWHEKEQLLKVAFPVDVRSTEATYDIQFGNVKRPTHWNTSWDYAKFESVAHQWVDLSEEGYGVSLLNDCKYGHDIKGNTIRLSLLKSAIHPDFEADQGTHGFTYSLYPHAGSWVQSGTQQEAFFLNNPVQLIEGRHESFVKKSLFKLSTDNVMIDAVKKSEDSNHVVLRIHEFTGRRTPVSIFSDFKINSWQECNLLENSIGPVSYTAVIELTLKPYEIRTFLIDMQA